MIVLPSPRGLTLVRQPEHAAMSAAIARAWRRPAALPEELWPRFLEAVRRHDDGWMLEEARPTLDERGAPHDFKSLPVRHHAAVWRESIRLAREDDPYVALLVAQHGRWLYSLAAARPDGGERLAALEFLDELDRVAEAIAGDHAPGGADRAAVDPASLLTARRLLAFFDALSLMLLGAIPDAGSTEDLAWEDRTGRLGLRREGAVLRVAPWPFVEEALEARAEAVEVEGRSFASPEELAAALHAGAERVIVSTIRSGT